MLECKRQKARGCDLKPQPLFYIFDSQVNYRCYMIEFIIDNLFYKSIEISCFSILCFSTYPVKNNVNAPSPVTLHAVPKLSWIAKIASIKAVPASSNPRTPVIRPKEAITVPPGTPGAPTANTPNNKQKRISVPGVGNVP